MWRATSSAHLLSDVNVLAVDPPRGLLASGLVARPDADEDAAISPLTAAPTPQREKPFPPSLPGLPPSPSSTGCRPARDPPGSSSHGYAPINAGRPFEASGGGKGRGRRIFGGGLQFGSD